MPNIPGGIINAAINKEDPFSEIKGYTPERIEIGEGETVRGQLKAILEGDSPLLQSARTRAAQESNRRGLINTSMAVTAGEEAINRTALPVAQQDAATFFEALQRNQQAANRAFEFSGEAANIAGRQERAGQQELGQIGATGEQQRKTLAQSGAQELEQIGAAGEQQRLIVGARGEEERETLAQSGAQDVRLQTLKGVQDIALQTLRGDQAKEIADIEAQYKNMTQSSASASAIFSQISRNIADILNDPNTSTEQKQSSVDYQIALLKSQLAVVGAIADLDLLNLLDFDGFPSVQG